MGRTGEDEAALLRAVVAAPDDDLPRLVYADWLEEHGRPERARFIRLQIEEDRDTSWCGRHRRDEEIRSLLSAHGEKWFRELPKWVWAPYRANPDWDGVTFRRGFIGHLRVTASLFLSHGVQLTDRTPVTSLQFREAGKLATELAVCPWLWRIRELDLSWQQIGDVGAAALFQSPYLPHVEELDLDLCGVTDVALKTLAGSAALPNLRVLRIGFNDVTDAGVRALARSPTRSRLEILRVLENHRVYPHLDNLIAECRFAVEA